MCDLFLCVGGVVVFVWVHLHLTLVHWCQYLWFYQFLHKLYLMIQVLFFFLLFVQGSFQGVHFCFLLGPFCDHFNHAFSFHLFLE